MSVFVLGIIVNFFIYSYGQYTSKFDRAGVCSHVRELKSTGNCDNFNSDPCACGSTDDCINYQKLQECVDSFDCPSLNDNPQECRRSHCFYDCGSGLCSTQEEGSWSNCSSKMGCSLKCSDICSCQLSGCEYDTLADSCHEVFSNECPPKQHMHTICRRSESFYHDTGKFCRSSKSGQCTIESTLLAVNLNGDETMDSRGIVYAAGKMVQYTDTYSIALPYQKEFDGDDAEIFENGLQADPKKRWHDRCITFNVTFCYEGHYEFSVKLVVPSDVHSSEKLMNIKFGNQYIFPEVDVGKLSGNKLKSIELVATFRWIKNGLFSVDGMDSFLLGSKTLPVSFCYSLCSHAQSGFIINAFSIVKLHDESFTKKRSFCKNYRLSDWECLISKCNFNYETGVCTGNDQEENLCKLCGKPGQENVDDSIPAPIRFCTDSSAPGRIQLGFSFDTTKPHAYANTIFPLITKDILKTLNDIYSGSEIAVTGSSNWDRYAFDTSPNHPSHNQPEGCYRRSGNFSTDHVQISNSAAALSVLYGADFPSESTLPAIAFLAADKTIGWIPTEKDQNGKNVFRIIAGLTDDDSLFYLPHPGTRTEFRLDGTDNCSTTLPPCYGLYRKIFEHFKISVIGFYVKSKYSNPNDLLQLYNEHFRRIGTPHCGASIQDTNDFRKRAPKIIENCIKQLIHC